MTYARKILLSAVLLFLVTFGLYYSSLSLGFVEVDENTVLLAHPNLYSAESLSSNLHDILFDFYPREEPLILRDITWLIDSYLFGFKNPFGYHFGNVTLNAMNTVLLFVFLLLNSNKRYSSEKRLLFSFMISMTFALLAVHVEPVSWVMGRKGLLTSFFMLLGLIFQTKYIEAGEKKNIILFYLATFIAVFAALLSKINALTFFMVLAMHQVFYPYLTGLSGSSDKIDFAHTAKKIIPSILPYLVISLIVFFWYHNIISQWGVLSSDLRGVENFSKQHICSLIKFTPLVIVKYLKLIFIPGDFSIDYMCFNIFTGLNTIQKLYSLTAFTGILFAYTASYIHRKDIFFYLAAFLFLMIPYLNIFYVGIWVANRYIYLTSFCIITVCFILVFDFCTEKSKTVKSFLVLLWVCFITINAVQTYHYQAVWKNRNTLWAYENNRANPTLMSYVFLTNSYILNAEEESDPGNKADFLEKAELVFEKAIVLFDVDTLYYSTNDRIAKVYYLKLYYLRGEIARLRGRPYQEQLLYYETACKLNSGKKTALPALMNRIAELYYRIAVQPGDEANRIESARRSVEYFKNYIKSLNKDKNKLDECMIILTKTLEPAFPFLDREIEEARLLILDQRI